MMGMPAVVAGVLFSLVFWSSRNVHPQTLSEHYFVTAMNAQKDGDLDSAKLWLNKLLQLKPGDQAARFRQAMIALSEDDKAKAGRIITTLAPEETVGYAPAHVFVASELAREPDEIGGIDLEDRVRWHLGAALKRRPRDVRARQMLAEYELLHQNLNDAIKHYSILEAEDPAVNLLLAQLHVAMGERMEAEYAAQRGLRHFKALAHHDGTNIDARIEWARLEAFLENYDKAAEILSKVAAYQRVPETKVHQLRRSLADVYYAWSEALRMKSPDDVDTRVQLLEMSLRFAPEDQRSYDSLTRLYDKAPEVGEKVEKMIARLAGQRDNAPMIHLNLAIQAVRNGNLNLEREHLELALRAAPRLGIAANNLAWNLAVSDPSPAELKRALKLASQAVQSAPDRFEFRATRGRILAMANRDKEAIEELEFASSKLKDRRDIRDSLSALYQRNDAPIESRNPLRLPAIP